MLMKNSLFLKGYLNPVDKLNEENKKHENR